MNKMFYIKDCYFRLPENFSGSCGDALMLLAKRRLEQEKEWKITNRTNDINSLDSFWKSEEKCIISYCFSTEEAFRSENKRTALQKPL